MKKIFILTGEPSGDKLASTVISKLMKDDKDIEDTKLNVLSRMAVEEMKKGED